MKTTDKEIEKAGKWFIENYHTPLDNCPVLLGIHENGDEDWIDVSIKEILFKYVEHETKSLQEENERLKKEAKSDKEFADRQDTHIGELMKEAKYWEDEHETVTKDSIKEVTDYNKRITKLEEGLKEITTDRDFKKMLPRYSDKIKSLLDQEQ